MQPTWFFLFLNIMGSFQKLQLVMLESKNHVHQNEISTGMPSQAYFILLILINKILIYINRTIGKAANGLPVSQHHILDHHTQ